VNRPAVIFAVLQTGASANGGVQSITNIMKGLQRFRPIILTNSDTDRTEDWRRSGFEVHIVQENASDGLRLNPKGYLGSYWRYHKSLRKLLAHSGARLVHANDPLAFQLALSAVKSSRGVRIAMNMRDTLDPGRPPPRLKYRFLFGSADHVFYLSQDMANRWTKVAANAKRSFTVTYSVVDLQKFTPRPFSRDGRPVVLLSGIIRPKKGQLEFLRFVAPQLAARNIETWIAGDFDPGTNTYDADCAAAAKPLGGHVRFLGYRSDLPELFARSSVVAVASRHEGLVRAMIEAMSCGRPVVSFDVSSAREMLEHGAVNPGAVVPAGDYASMADALLRYCEDPIIAARAGEAGARRARLFFEGPQVVKRYEDAYAALST